MAATPNQVERACADLTRDGQPVTFAHIAERTGTARSTLYRNSELRALFDNAARWLPLCQRLLSPTVDGDRIRPVPN
jgi:hypothetical protein